MTLISQPHKASPVPEIHKCQVITYLPSHQRNTQTFQTSLQVNPGSPHYRPLTTQPSGRPVFGGLLLAQVTSAATSTVPAGFHVCSSHSSILRPVIIKAQGTVTYRVDRTHDGHTSATRVVRAFQPSRDDIATISFQAFLRSIPPGIDVLSYNIPIPDLRGLRPENTPEDLKRQTMAASTQERTGKS
ncbi:hypothetical protein F5Y04DRAFT_265712 [Hypomontagnella monticulosa]|nr:hypothetical protein F5Y04DRAFT_265712 [Hypomontagnella monticulosa]